jgi:hypothetical protein
VGQVAGIGEIINVYKTVENLKVRNHLEDLSVYDIKMDLKEKRYGDVEWIYMAQNKVQWQALVNIVMNV